MQDRRTEPRSTQRRARKPAVPTPVPARTVAPDRESTAARSPSSRASMRVRGRSSAQRRAPESSTARRATSAASGETWAGASSRRRSAPPSGGPARTGRPTPERARRQRRSSARASSTAGPTGSRVRRPAACAVPKLPPGAPFRSSPVVAPSSARGMRALTRPRRVHSARPKSARPRRTAFLAPSASPRRGEADPSGSATNGRRRRGCPELLTGLLPVSHPRAVVMELALVAIAPMGGRRHTQGRS
jgi:hypothetical protein